MIQIDEPLQLACSNVPDLWGPIRAGIGCCEFAICVASLTSARGS
jgi:hypothetical protein